MKGLSTDEWINKMKHYLQQNIIPVLKRNEGYSRLVHHSKINYGKLSSQQDKEEKSLDHINRCRKIICQIQCPFMNKNFQQHRNRRKLLQPNKEELFKKTTTLDPTSYLLVIRQMLSLSNWEQSKDVPAYHNYPASCVEVLANAT